MFTSFCWAHNNMSALNGVPIYQSPPYPVTTVLPHYLSIYITGKIVHLCTGKKVTIHIFFLHCVTCAISKLLALFWFCVPNFHCQFDYDCDLLQIHYLDSSLDLQRENMPITFHLINT